MLPSPPSVAATKPFNPVMKPISKNAKNIEPSMMPAAPAIMPEIAKV
jgi:hypothetical protein